ncbi:MAG UNVERIFIED_CONTAM: DUF1080 domain-containing protein [Planctomycetaceae bacterium]|jgi:hypothetical protein
MTAFAGTKADQPDFAGLAANTVGVPAAGSSLSICATMCAAVAALCRPALFSLVLIVSWLYTSQNSSGQQASVPPQSQPPDTTAKSNPESNDSNAPFADLLAADLKQTWKAYPLESLEGTEADWSVVKDPADSEPVLICRGRMKGFLWTLEKWQDFEFTGEWKYPEDNDGNSGILVHTQREDRIRPTAIQIQLHQPKAGSIFPAEMQYPITCSKWQTVSQGQSIHGMNVVSSVKAAESQSRSTASGPVKSPEHVLWAATSLCKAKVLRCTFADSEFDG